MRTKLTNLFHFNRHVRRPIMRIGMLMAMVALLLMGVLNMSALTADKDVDRKEGGLQSFPVAASTTIYKGALVCLDTSGYLVAAADTHGYKFAGVAYEKKVESTAVDGAVSCRVYTDGVFLFTATSITQAMVGQLLYATDSATVDETASNYVAVGQLVQYVGTTSGWVDIGKRNLGTTQTQTWPVSGGEPLAVDSIFTLATSGVHKAVQGICTYSPATSGYATSIGVAGKVTLTAAKSFTGGIGYMWGVQGQMDFGASCVINNASSIFAALRGVITGTTPVDTECQGVSCLYLDNLCTSDLNGFSTGKSSFIHAHNAGGYMDAAIRLWGGNKVPVLFRLDACGTMIAVGAAKSGASANIAIDWEGTTYYINVLQA